MKTYLFDTLNRFRRFSENLDVKTTLCNKVWLVFNDSGEKEVYIFQENGTLLITYSGRVTHGTWQYIAANKSIIISAGSQSYMVHPEFTDRVLFALKVDGTNECAFLIDENNAQSFAPRSYTELMKYFEAKELKAQEEEQRRHQIADNRRKTAVALVTILADVEQYLKDSEEELAEIEQRLQKERERNMHIEFIFDYEIKYKYRRHLDGKDFFWVIPVMMLCLGFPIFLPMIIAPDAAWMVGIGCLIAFAEAFLMVPLLEGRIVLNRNVKRRMMKYIKAHMDDWETPLLVEKYNSQMPKRFRIDLEVLRILEKYKM